MKFLLFVLILLSFVKSNAETIRITDVNFENFEQNGKVTISFSGELKKAPVLTIKEGTVQLSLSPAIVWPQVNRKISVQKKEDSELKAYQYDKETVRVRAVLPFELMGMEDKINLVLKDSFAEVVFPNGKNNIAKKEKRADEYDESYLDYLIEQKNGRENPASEEKEDRIEVTQSSLKESVQEEAMEEKSFDVMAYIGKYIAFMAFIILGLYGLVFLLKRGVIKKGKLGFLNDTNLVSILNTTYLGPKRSLLVIKVHDSILLLGNSEMGITYISELKDVAELIKEGERGITGKNFDTTVDSIDEGTIESKVKLKKGSPDESKESLSDQIKRKVKDLRPIQ